MTTCTSDWHSREQDPYKSMHQDQFLRILSFSCWLFSVDARSLGRPGRGQHEMESRMGRSCTYKRREIFHEFEIHSLLNFNYQSNMKLLTFLLVGIMAALASAAALDNTGSSKPLTARCSSTIHLLLLLIIIYTNLSFGISNMSFYRDGSL